MTAHLDVDPDLSSNNPSSKLHAISHAPSSIDRSYSELPITPPSPPHVIPPEYRHLREQLLLNWANYKLGCDPPFTRLSELLDGEALINLIETVAGAQIQPPGDSEPKNLDTAIKLLHNWLGQRNVDLAVSMEAVAFGDQDQLVSLLSFILTQHQAYIINAMQDDTFGFISSHVHPVISIPTHAATTPADIQQVLLTYAQVTLAEYVNASLVPFIDDCSDAWQDGLLFMALLHCHEPDCVRDMQDFVLNTKDRSRWRDTLETAFRRAHNAFHVPILLDADTLANAIHVDEESILAYLVEFVHAVRARNKNEQVKAKRQSDIERWQSDTVTYSTSSLSSAEDSDNGQQQQKEKEQEQDKDQDQKQYSQPQITLKTTYTQVRLTKTTKAKSLDEEFQTRVASLLEKIAQLQNQLVVMIPTRSSNYQMRSTSVATPDTQYSFDESENGDHSRKLHPLQAGQEDLRSYEQNFAAYQAMLQSFKQDDLDAFHQFCNLEIDTDEPETSTRIKHIDDAFKTLLEDTDKAEHLLETFRHGFGFAQMCAGAREELDAAQTKMHKMTPASTDTDILDMETKVEKAASMIDQVAKVYSDLVQSIDDEAYPNHYDALVRKSKLVKSWVEEVRVWFAEAERIRKWIDIRTAKLEEIVVPESLQCSELPLTRQEIEALNATHKILQKEIEAFDNEDMARLRVHVKPLMGGQLSKELSPADARTIEITLTAIHLLEQLKGTLQHKSSNLRVLTNRLIWEEELTKTKAWVVEADKEIEDFVRENARWQVEEDVPVVDGADETWHRDQLMAQERLKELVIQRLLMLENKRAEFENGQYTVTIESFDDLEDSLAVNMPGHLNARQVECNQQCDDLFKRINFARQVVEQRLKVMDFLYQVFLVKKDVEQLQVDIREAQMTALPDDNDRDITARVQEIHEHIVQLVTSTAGRIPYPVPGLEIDVEENDASNGAIREVISEKRTELVLLGEDLDNALNGFRDVLQMHRRGKQFLIDATRLSEWADERLKQLRKARVDASTDASSFTTDDLRRLERDRDNLTAKLKDKENEAIDVLTKIQMFLDTVQKMETSIDKESLDEASQYLTNVFDRLRESLDEHILNLENLRKKMEDDSTYFEQVGKLRTYLTDTRASLPGLRQTCGFITGQSEEQDRERYEMLSSTLDKMVSSFKMHSGQLESLKNSLSVAVPDGVENAEEMRQVLAVLEKDWVLLGNDIEDLKHFTVTVADWYQRQRKLGIVENVLLDGLHERISELAKAGWTESDLEDIEAKINEAFKVLGTLGQEIKAAAFNKDDPLETANYSCARDRHMTLMNKVQTVQANVDALRKNANNALAFSEFLSRIDAMFTDIQAQKELINRRMSTVGQSEFAAGSMKEIEQLSRKVLGDAAASEEEVQRLQQRIKQLYRDTRMLEKDGYSAQSVSEPVKRVEESVGQLVNAIAVEKRQAAFIRKTQVHAKAANDLHAWMSQCNNAINQLSSDVCIKDEAELRNEMEMLKHKIAEMHPVVRAFQDMPPRIFSGKDGRPIDLREISVDSEKVKSAIKNREAEILGEWDQLAKQLEAAKLSVQNSWRDVEIVRKVKEIVTLVGHLKDRVNAVQISGAFSEELIKATDGNDLSMVTTCPLSMMPIEHELLGAKAELDGVDRDIEQNLQTKMAELETMLNNNSESEDIFSGQRTEIAAAVRGLTDLIRMKREAIAAAEKLETFLTVVEELEVMLSAMFEVVGRASPSYARIVDGQPSRADLQGMLIDLDTRYRYYEPKIGELLSEAKEVAEPVMNDKRVVKCLDDLKEKWDQLQEEASLRRQELLGKIGPLGDPFFSRLAELEGRRNRLQKRSSMPSMDILPTPTRTTPRLVKAQPKARAQSVTTTRTPPLTRQSYGSGADRRRSTPPGSHLLHQSPSRAKSKTPEAYVADPKNDLDVALGNIVNDSPYKVRVKMVPGEVGRYWFGDKNPKLAYCRILRSRMVMVRVGGGWVELSQFLRDQRLLEDGNFVPRQAPTPHQQAITPTTRGGRIQEGVISIRGGGRSPGITMRPQMRESRSTSFQRGLPGMFGHGVKEGNKFLVPVDSEGNQVEVKMTKAKFKDTKFTTPRRSR